MSIITLEDRDVYFPGLTLSDPEFLSAIFRAEIIAQGVLGSNRSLEIRQYRDVRDIANSTQSFYLGHLPILSDPAPVVEVRRHGIDSFGREIPASQWIALEPGQYEIDQETGEIVLQVDVLTPSYSGITSYPDALHGRNFGRTTRFTQSRTTYSSGFDFTEEPLSDDAALIKGAIAGLMLATTINANYNSGGNTGIESFTLQGFYSVSYGSGANNSSGNSGGVNPSQSGAMADYLALLQKYRPNWYMG